jgi:hypothetical protein
VDVKQALFSSGKSRNLSSDHVTYGHYTAGLHENDHPDPLAYGHEHGRPLNRIPSFHGASIYKNPATNRKKNMD